MSEFIDIGSNWNHLHRRLLVTASVAALLISAGSEQSRAADSNAPPFWVELGGQFATLEGSQDAFLPPFLLPTPRPPFDVASPAVFEKAPASSWDGSGRISFEPSGSDWVFSASVLYGKSTRQAYRAQKTAQPTPAYNAKYVAYQAFAAGSSESHTVLDFQAGKDVGLGMFGTSGNSVLSLGVRYAQLNASKTTSIQSQPTNISPARTHYKFYASSAMKRKFIGVGPSLSLNASAKLIDNRSMGDIALDWGLNGAILFGRQETKGHTLAQENHIVNYKRTGAYPIPRYQYPDSIDRRREVAVPNLGGFAGLSWRYSHAKVSFGYRADFFFGAMDGGIDTAHRENVGFYGPFATVSVGIGG